MFIIIALIAFVTALTRFLPFIIFSKNVPSVISKLGKILPASLIAMITIYSCKDIFLSFTNDSTQYGILGIISIIFTLALHILFKRVILSIIGGTCFHIIILEKCLS